MFKNFIEKTLIQAGKIVMKEFGQISQVTAKDQSNIVTEVDLKSEECITRRIRKKFPSHNIIAEETGFQDRHSEYTWIVDPIDGTSNYAAGIPCFGIVTSLLKNWQPIEAGIYLPFYEGMYYARKNHRSLLNNDPIRVTQEHNLKNVLVSYGLDYSEDISKTKQELKIIEFLVKNVRNLRMFNSVVDFCYVASGKLGAYINQASMIWDNAAPYLLIKEAGGEMTDIEGKPLDFEVIKANYKRNYTYIAASKHLHPKLLSLVTQAKSKKKI